MPRGDKTGPMGQGAKTGRGKGFCSGSNQPGCMDDSPGGGGRGLGRGTGRGMGQGGGRGRGMGQGIGRGMGRGAGRGLGRGWRNNAPVENDYPVENLSNENTRDKESLENKAKQLEAELAEVKNKLTDLESE